MSVISIPVVSSAGLGLAARFDETSRPGGRLAISPPSRGTRASSCAGESINPNYASSPVFRLTELTPPFCEINAISIVAV